MTENIQDDWFDKLTENIENYLGCRCPACMSLIMTMISKDNEGGVSKKSCLNGKCAANTDW
jgi:hypothetical protein